MLVCGRQSYCSNKKWWRFVSDVTISFDVFQRLIAVRQREPAMPWRCTWRPQLTTVAWLIAVCPATGSIVMCSHWPLPVKLMDSGLSSSARLAIVSSVSVWILRAQSGKWVPAWGLFPYPSPSLLLISLPLFRFPFPVQLGCLGSAASSPCIRVRGRTTAANAFVWYFSPENVSGGNNILSVADLVLCILPVLVTVRIKISQNFYSNRSKNVLNCNENRSDSTLSVVEW